MKYKIYRQYILIILLSLLTLPVVAEIDDLQLAIDKSVTPQLRWDNLQGGEEWLQGPKPEKTSYKHVVDVPAAETISILMKKDSWLRIISTSHADWKKYLQLEISSDGLLFIEEKLTLSNLADNALVKPLDTTYIVRLKNTAQQSLRLELYASRYFLASPRLLYRKPLDLALQKAGLQIIPDIGWQTYSSLAAGEDLEVNIQGPKRIALNLRQAMHNTHKPTNRSSINIFLDNQAVFSREIIFKEDVHHAIRIAGKRQSISAADISYLNIPEGQHKLSLSTTAQVYIQLNELDKQYWLQQNKLQSISWFNPREGIFKSITPRLSSIQSRLVEQSQDNRLTEGTLESLDKAIKTTSSSWSRQQAMNRLQRNIVSAYSHLQALSPTAGKSYQQTWLRYFKKQLGYSNKNPVYYLSESFFDERLKSIAQNAFYSNQQNKLNFSLTPLNIDTEIQLLIYPADINNKKTLWLQIDNQKARKIHIDPLAAADKFVQPDINEKIIKKQPCCSSIFGNLALSRGSMNLVRVASIRLPVSALSQQIKIWQAADASPVWIAVQQRRSSSYQLSEQQYLYYLSQLETPLAYFISNLKAYKEFADEFLTPQDALQNHWQPIFKNLNASYQQQTKNIKPITTNTENLISHETANKIRQQAEQAEQSQQWLLAIEYWSELWPYVSGKQQEKALLKLLESLQHSGQHSLSRQLQKAIIFSSLSTDFVYQQLNILSDKYKDEDNGNARISLLSAFFVQHSSSRSLQLLSQAMLDAGRWQQALQLQLILPENDRRLNAVLFSSLKSGWLDLFDQQLARAHLHKSENHYWLGLKSLFTKNYSLAKQHLSKSARGKNWLAILNESQTIKQKLLSASKSQREQALLQWQRLQQAIFLQNKNDWHSLASLIKHHAGRLEITQPTTKNSLSYYLATAENDIQLEVTGPTLLRLQIRPLHNQSDSIQALNTSYQLYDGKKRYDFLINNNLPTDNWQLNTEIKGEKFLAGKTVTQEIFLAAGVHQLRLSSASNLLLRLQRKQPRIPASVLPTLTGLAMSHVLELKDDNTFIEDYRFDKQWLSSQSYLNISPAHQELINIALQLEAKADNSSDLISRAEKIYYDEQRKAELNSVISRIRSHSQWELVNSIDKSDGFWVQKLSSWQAESPQNRIYQALLDDADSAHELLRNGNSRIISLFNPQDTEIELELKSLSPAFIPTQTLDAYYQLDNDKPVPLSITKYKNTIKIPVPRGRHSIKLGLLQAPLFHRLWLSLSEKNRQRMDLLKSRRYQLASTEQDLLYNIQGPAWLRIDKLLNKQLQTHYQYIPGHLGNLRLKAEGTEKSAFYRVFYRARKQAVKTSPNIIKLARPAYDNTINGQPISNKPQTAGIKNLRDGWRLGKQEDPTLSYQVSQTVQNLLVGELTSTADQYLQATIAYRHYWPMSKQWFYLSALSRHRQQGGDTLGLKSRLRGRFDFIPIDWTMDGQLFSQQLTTGFEWSGQFKLSLSQFRPLNSYFYHLPKMQITNRWLSMNVPGLETNIDQDVFSQYKSDHLSSLRLSETLVYQAYKDMEFYLGAERLSNSKWLSVDQYRSRLGWRLLWANTRWDINARTTDFRSDNNRLLPISRRVIQARVLLEQWITSVYRMELSASLDKDLDSNEKTLNVQLSIHQSEGRGYMDFSPAELLFRNLRQAELLPELNNEFN